MKNVAKLVGVTVSECFLVACRDEEASCC